MSLFSATAKAVAETVNFRSPKKIVFRNVNSLLHVGNLEILHRIPLSISIIILYYCFGALFKTGTTKSLLDMSVVASYWLRNLLLLSPIKGSKMDINAICRKHTKHCHFDNLPNHLLFFFFKWLSRCDRYMAHMLWLCRVVAMMALVLYIQIQSLRMEL